MSTRRQMQCWRSSWESYLLQAIRSQLRHWQHPSIGNLKDHPDRDTVPPKRSYPLQQSRLSAHCRLWDPVTSKLPQTMPCIHSMWWSMFSLLLKNQTKTLAANIHLKKNKRDIPEKLSSHNGGHFQTVL